jgi:HAD superfamily hydrolase (TIGR01509 family)
MPDSSLSPAASGNCGAQRLASPEMCTASLVIFDCDGVLVDSEHLSHTVLCGMLIEMGADISFEETVDRFIGTTMPKCVERITALLGRAPPGDFLKQFAIRTKAAFTAELRAVPGIEGVLSSIHMPFCVASNGNRAKVNFTLGHTGLLPLFSGRIFTAEDVEHPKPAPDLFLHAARSLNVPPAQVIVVEDTPTGITAARAAGMHAIGFAAMTPLERLRGAGAHVVVKDMLELQFMLGAR